MMRMPHRLPPCRPCPAALDCLDAVPEGRPVSWTGLPEGSPFGHPGGGGPVVIDRICGPVVKTAADTFTIRYDRMGTDNPRRSGDLWLLASHPGDGEYRRAVRQSLLHFPLRNEQGAEQRITFPPLADVAAGPKALKLGATSSAGLPVYYYVREGPAEVADDGTLAFTPIPPRARFPVKVTVVAWQWGRSIEPRVKTATPVERTFSIVSADGAAGGPARGPHSADKW